MLFFFNFRLCIRSQRNETIIFVFFLSHPPSSYSGFKWSHNDIFNFFQFLYYFVGIFYYALGRNETERKYLFSFFLGLFHPILALNDVIMIFINFLNFFAISLEFSITRQVGTERNYNFYFLSFSFSFNRFWLEMAP